MTETTDSFFVPEGDAFRATEHTRGPWSMHHQHGGPPSALLARAIEQHVASDVLRVARLTVVFHKPIAIASFRLGVETVRAGKKVRVVRAQLLSTPDGAAVATADAVLVRRDGTTGVSETVRDAPNAPGACPPFEFSFFAATVGYHTAMEARHIAGTFGHGAMALWMRMRVALVPGEAPSPLQRVVAAADSGNGVSVALDSSRATRSSTPTSP